MGISWKNGKLLFMSQSNAHTHLLWKFRPSKGLNVFQREKEKKGEGQQTAVNRKTRLVPISSVMAEWYSCCREGHLFSGNVTLPSVAQRRRTHTYKCTHTHTQFVFRSDWQQISQSDLQTYSTVINVQFLFNIGQDVLLFPTNRIYERIIVF